MRRQLFSMVLSAVALSAPTAWASTVMFDLDADCTADCDNVGLSLDDLVIGRITLSTANFVASGPVARADLLDFVVGFGTTSTVIIKDLSPGYAFAATWGADTSSVESVTFIASGSAVLNDPGPFVSIGPGGNTLSLQGTCRDVACTVVSDRNTATISPPRFRPLGDVTPVPLPPSALLLGAGALALAAAARRRSRA